MAFLVVAALTSSLLAGCGSSTRMMIEPTTETLAEKKRGVAVVKFSMLDQDCKQQALLIGAREGNGHRLVRKLFAPGAAPATTANAAEAELDPGEYHVLGYLCQRARSTVSIGNEGGPQTASLGRFTIGPGEVVNIGHITFKSTWGSKDVKIGVGDWALADLNRFREERPKLFAGMQTRLLDLRAGKPISEDEQADRCGQLKAMHASGKVQQVPKACT